MFRQPHRLDATQIHLFDKAPCRRSSPDRTLLYVRTTFYRNRSRGHTLQE